MAECTHHEIQPCANPECKTPSGPQAAKGLCWNCYQGQRRAAMPKRHVSPCIEGRRYHSYDHMDKCRHCEARRIFS